MNAQVPSDAMTTQQENGLICEKLLGFKKHCDRPDCHDWRSADDKRYWNSPAFTTWADAGLILEALRTHGLIAELQAREKEYWFGICWPVSDNYVFDCRNESGPLAIRTTALAYIKAVNS